MIYLGDIDEDQTIDFKWSTNDSGGGSITRATDGTVSVYKANGTTQTTTGVTDTEDFDSLTGIHHCRIATTDAFYATGNDYQVVLSAATIDGETVNAVIAHFSIENRTVNVRAISDSSTAADNAESILTDTGNVDIKLGQVTIDPTADVVAISVDGGTTGGCLSMTCGGAANVIDIEGDDGSNATIKISNVDVDGDVFDINAGATSGKAFDIDAGGILADLSANSTGNCVQLTSAGGSAFVASVVGSDPAIEVTAAGGSATAIKIENDDATDPTITLDNANVNGDTLKVTAGATSGIVADLNGFVGFDIDTGGDGINLEAGANGIVISAGSDGIDIGAATRALDLQGDTSGLRIQSLSGVGAALEIDQDSAAQHAVYIHNDNVNGDAIVSEAGGTDGAGLKLTGTEGLLLEGSNAGILAQNGSYGMFLDATNSGLAIDASTNGVRIENAATGINIDATTGIDVDATSGAAVQLSNTSNASSVVDIDAAYANATAVTIDAGNGSGASIGVNVVVDGSGSGYGIFIDGDNGAALGLDSNAGTGTLDISNGGSGSATKMANSGAAATIDIGSNNANGTAILIDAGDGTGTANVIEISLDNTSGGSAISVDGGVGDAVLLDGAVGVNVDATTGIDMDCTTAADIDTSAVAVDITSSGGNGVAVQGGTDKNAVQFWGQGTGHGLACLASNGNAMNLASSSGLDLAADEIGTPVDLASGASLSDNLNDIAGSGFDTTNDSLVAISSAINNLAVGSAAISTVATSEVITTGVVVTGDYTDTTARDGTYHQVADAAGAVDFYYETNITGTGVPVSVTVFGRSNGGNDDINVFGYNWGGASWEQVGTIEGQNGGTDTEHTYSLYSSHVGTGADLGKVRVRFQNTGLSNSDFYIDQFYVSYAVVNQSVGYANGAIWVDTVGGTAGTTLYVNGTADNPVDSWSDALTISGSLGITRFQIINGSSITLTGNSDGYTLLGANWSLDLNGQSIANAVFDGANITGTAIGSGWETFRCTIADGATTTIADGLAQGCAVAGDIVMSAAGTYYFDQCFSGVAGTATPSIDFGALVGDTNLNFRHYSGGIEVKNMGGTGTDKMSLEGWGQLVINANCTGGTIAVRGAFKITDNTNGAVTVDEDANYKTDTITEGFAQASTTNTITLAATASATDGAYDPAKIFIVSGTGAGQSRLIYQYAGATKIAAVDRDWKVNPSTDSKYRIVSDAGREHVNEGLAQAGGANTITLNALASSSNDAYNGQMVFLRSGTGEDQVRYVIDYDGATKIATVDSNWAVNPNNTTGYAMLPNIVATDTSAIADAVWDEALAGHTAAGSTGEAQNSIDDILTDTADMQPKFGTIQDLGSGATIGDNLGDIFNSSGLSLSDTVDGVTLDTIFQYMMAMFNGKFDRNTPGAGDITFYKRDNSTTLSQVNVATTGRTRTL